MIRICYNLTYYHHKKYLFPTIVEYKMSFLFIFADGLVDIYNC